MGDVADYLLDTKNTLNELDWIQGRLARGKNGETLNMLEDYQAAKEVCIMGAMYVAGKGLINRQATYLLEDIIEEKYGPYSIPSFNDEIACSKSDVLDILDEVIMEAKDRDL